MSSIYKNNISVVEQQNLTINRDLQICIAMIKKQFLKIISMTKKTTKKKIISLKNKIIPIHKLASNSIPNIRSKKECNVKHLSTLSIKEKKLLSWSMIILK